MSIIAAGAGNGRRGTRVGRLLSRGLLFLDLCGFLASCFSTLILSSSSSVGACFLSEAIAPAGFLVMLAAAAPAKLSMLSRSSLAFPPELEPALS